MVSYFKGMMGQPAWGFPEELQKVVLKGEEPITCRPGELLEPVDFDKAWEEVSAFMPDDRHRHAGHLPTASIPRWYEEFWQPPPRSTAIIMRMGSHVFFNGMALGETNKINIEDGKTLVIKYLGLGDLNEDGTRNVQFELNGMRREVAVPDPSAAGSRSSRSHWPIPRTRARSALPSPVMVSKINVKAGDTVEENQVIAVIEAMKMETSVTARMAGKVKSILVSEGSTVKAGELLITVE